MDVMTKCDEMETGGMIHKVVGIIVLATSYSSALLAARTFLF